MAAHRFLTVLTSALLGVSALPAMATGPSPSGAPQPPLPSAATDAGRGNQTPGYLDLPYGTGYEQRLRAAGSQDEAENHATSGASQGAGASRGGSGGGSGGSGGSGGHGNGGSGRGR